MSDEDSGGAVYGAIVVDLSGNLQTVGIPKDAHGLMVTMMPDNNANMTGGFKIYIGDPGVAPWGIVAATGTHMNNVNGPIAGQAGAQGRAYLTLVKLTGGAQGIVLLEFTRDPLKRSVFSS